MMLPTHCPNQVHNLTVDALEGKLSQKGLKSDLLELLCFSQIYWQRNRVWNLSNQFETVSETSLKPKPVWNRVWWNQFRLVQTQFNWLGSFANMFACVLRFSSSGQSGNYLNVDEFRVGPLVRQNLMNFIYYKLPNSKIHFLTIYDIIRFQYISWMFQWLGHIWLGPGIVAQRWDMFFNHQKTSAQFRGALLVRHW
jgi:hypothetical protein